MVFDMSAPAVEELAREGATASSDLRDFVNKLEAPRAVWLMVPRVRQGRSAVRTGLAVGGRRSDQDNADLICQSARWYRTGPRQLFALGDSGQGQMDADRKQGSGRLGNKL